MSTSPEPPGPVKWSDGWKEMEIGFTKLVRILDGYDEPDFTAKEYIQLYTVVYNMCTQKPPDDFSEELYNGYIQLIHDYVPNKVLPSINSKHDVFLLEELEKRWLNHKVMLKWLSRFFQYLERYHIPRNSLRTLKDAGHNCFLEMVYEKIQVQVRNVILSLIDREREGEQIDRSAVKNVLSMFVELEREKGTKPYENDFEAFMLQNTDAYYSRKASKHILVDSCPDYLLMAEECLKNEKDRATHYLHSSSESKLVEKTQDVLLFQHLNQIIEKENSGLHIMLRDDKIEDLSRMYRLFKKIDKGLEPVAAIFKKHVTSAGVALFKEIEDAAKSKKAYVNKVLEFHEKYLSYCNDCFMGDINFHKALKEGFESFFNKDIVGMSCAEMLSTFCDTFLQKGSAVEKLGDDAIEKTIEKVALLLAYLQEKDLFAEFSRKKLARRLLTDRSSNLEHEKHFISKLKQQFGSYFTSKMEGMITDLSLARETQAEFETYIKDNPHVTQGADLSVTVLTTGFWPTYKTVDFNIPPDVFYCIDAFKTYYKCKANSRKLTWIFSLGGCNLIGRFDSKIIELQVSTYQAAALLLFNTTDRFSYQDIATELKLPNDELIRVLHSLSCGKYKILLKQPNSKAISHSDVFEFNSKFTDKMRRIKVPLPHIEEKRKVIEDVDKERKFSIDAALVRIMKSRKVLGHQQLVLECVNILNRMFKPDIKVIKKRIEDLILRDYLARDEENPNSYKYLA
ncbi:hypothetical protein AQUCO_00300808v1 [Aquilegia coerulea]|uniref:Cullin family profile domain-containing protein n=1 Tax=Aquilegia coerulea TaxID=218851 RepID=A0A2G5F0J6_AQUCA|nr:hypothetical protein AQUCO_00300808v1 [Aquilegia coerulea]